jgi:hypothetical protein
MAYILGIPFIIAISDKLCYPDLMKIEFDQAKNERNIKLRGLSFEMVKDLE